MEWDIYIVELYCLSSAVWIQVQGGGGGGVGGIIFGQCPTPDLIYKFALCLSICELRTWIPHIDICKGHPCAF